MSPAQLTPQERLLRAETEAQFQERVKHLARLSGWWVHHHTHSIHSEPGWPDLVLLRPPEAVFVELKRETGRTTPVQERVIGMMRLAGLECHVWRPSDWETVVARLRRRR